MADMVTKQELEEAKIDVKHAGEAVNTKKTITPRYGAPFKSLPLVAAEAQAKADEVVAQGFYRGYTTEALLLAAKPAVAEMRARADDTRKIYRWNRTSAEGVTPVTGNWVDTGLSELDQAKADATTKANAAELNAKNYTDTAKAEAVSDAINSFYNVSSNRRDVYQLHDSEFNVLLSIDEKGNLLLPQSNMPVQNALGVYPELKTKTRLPQEGLQSISSELMSYLPFSGISYVPCPLGLQPQKYSINPADLGNLKVGVTTQVPLNTRFANDDKVVHPGIVEFYGGFRGYRYLLAITSYETASVENPSIFGSNDLETFELLDGFVQPLAIPILDGVMTGDFLSDVNLSYDPVNGLLVCLYRESANDPVLGTVTGIFARTTRNGYEWSEPFAISETEPYSAGDKKLSPSLIYNPTRKKWMLWVGTGGGMRLRTSDSLYGPWTIEHTKFYDGRGIWHHEVRYVGGLFVMLTSNSEGGSNFEFLTSTDGENWTYRGNVLSENQLGIYKPSFVVNLNADKTLNLDVLWTDNFIRKLFIGKTNSINYEVA